MFIVFEILNLLSTIISLTSVIIVVIQLLHKVVIYYTKKFFILKTLMFRPRSCYISQSIYKIEQRGSINQYVSLGSMHSFQALSSLLYDNNIKVLPFSKLYAGNNIIHLGGPAANANVNALWASAIKNLHFVTYDYEKEIYEEYGLNPNFNTYIDKNAGTRGLSTNNIFLPIDKKIIDYGIFIRIPYNKKEGINYTTHIIFGGTSFGTEQTVAFFCKNYKLIYKKCKEKKYFGKRYCFAIPINQINNSTELIGLDNIIDLTQNVF